VAGAAPCRGRLDNVFRAFIRQARANLAPSAKDDKAPSDVDHGNQFEVLPEAVEKPAEALGIFVEVEAPGDGEVAGAEAGVVANQEQI
jgi:hypothetical protein